MFFEKNRTKWISISIVFTILSIEYGNSSLVYEQNNSTDKQIEHNNLFEKKPWQYIKKIPMNKQMKYCALECYFDENCATWNFYQSQIHDEDKSNYCYLESMKYHELMGQFNRTIPSISSTSNLFRHQRLLTDSVAIGRSTLLTYDQSFVFGCSYTITIWAWVWKIPKSGGEMAIFSTRESLPNLRQCQSLLPSVVFNVGYKKNNLFFSTIRDASNDYEGAWGPTVPLQQWVHIGLTFAQNKMKIFINGVEVSDLIMTKKKEFHDQMCPEDKTDETFMKTADLLNNTIFQVGGSKVGAMLGMVQHLDIFHGVTLSHQQINQLMHSSIPSQFTTLDLLLDEYENNDHHNDITTYSQSDDFCDYELVNYQLCPLSICGGMCLFNNVNGTSDDIDTDTDADTDDDEMKDLEELEEFEEFEDSDTDEIDEIILDEAIFYDAENNIEIKLELLGNPSSVGGGETPPPSSTTSSDPAEIMEVTQDGEGDLEYLIDKFIWNEETEALPDILFEKEVLSDDKEFHAIWNEEVSTIEEDETYFRQYLQKLRESGPGGINQELLELLEEEFTLFQEENREYLNSLLEKNHLTKLAASSELSKDLGHEWQEYKNEYLQSIRADKELAQIFGVLEENKNLTRAKVKDIDQVITKEDYIDINEKIAEETQRILLSAEVKVNIETHIRDPYYRRKSSPMLQPLLSNIETHQLSETTTTIDAATTPATTTSTLFLSIKDWISTTISQSIQISNTMLQNSYQNLLIATQNQLDHYGLNITLTNDTRTNSTSSPSTTTTTNVTSIEKLKELMLSKLSLRGDIGIDQVELITKWIESLLAKQKDGNDDLVGTFASLMDSASFLVLDDSFFSKKVDKSIPNSANTVTKLYDQAMLWYTGRHLINTYHQHQHHQFNNNAIIETSKESVDVHRPSDFDFILNKYQQEVNEPAQSALMYAMWLSDELEMDYPDLIDHSFHSQTISGMLGQPIRLALGYRTFISNNIDINTNIDMQESIKTIVTGSPEYLAIGRASSIEFVPYCNQSHQNSSENQDDTNSPIKELDFATHQFLNLLAAHDSKLTAKILETSVELKNSLDKIPPNENYIQLQPTPMLHQTELKENSNCLIAGSYYLPIMKYVTSHFGDVETGVGIPDGVLLADLPSPDEIFTGLGARGVGGGAGGGGGGGRGAPGNSGSPNSVVETSLREHYEAEAAAGNPNAQLWLGIRHYWGTGGLTANATNARKYFEKAAAQNHSEALFCLGALYENGQGGFPRNRTKALQLFHQSASQKIPWPAALQALGNYHWNTGPSEARNVTLAIQYFEKAAEMGHANGYYSLGLMYRESSLSVIKQNIPLAIHLMSLAASMGHIRSMSSLAHALYDMESWLGHYAREQQELSRHQTSEQNTTSEDDLLLRWGYNSSNGIQIILSSTSEIIRFPEPLRPDCSIALPLMKHLAEHTFRPNDLSKAGLAAFMSGDIWEALEFYEEAADLGVSSAQENTAFLYELISDKFCLHHAPLSSSSSSSSSSHASSSRSSFWKEIQNWELYENFLDHYNQWMARLEEMVPSSKDWWRKNKVEETLHDLNRVKFRGYDKILQSHSCSDYFHDMALIRWIQVANSGDVEAIRNLAQKYQGVESSKQLTSSNNRLTINETKAALLYAIAASEHGDISSIMSLGWLVQHGRAGVKKNLTLAKQLFEKAGELEAVYGKYGLAWATTNGVAPYLAGTIARIELWLQETLFVGSVPGSGFGFGFDDGGEESLTLVGYLIIVLFILGLIRIVRQIN